MHILGIDYRYKLIEIPETAKSIPIGQKNKQGRPKRPELPNFTKTEEQKFSKKNRLSKKNDEDDVQGK